MQYTHRYRNTCTHYTVIMSMMASEITGVSVVYSTICSVTETKSKCHVTGHCEGNLLVTGEFLTQRAVTLKMFPFDDVIMVYHSRNLSVIIVWPLGCSFNTLRPFLHVNLDYQLLGWQYQTQFLCSSNKYSFDLKFQIHSVYTYPSKPTIFPVESP